MSENPTIAVVIPCYQEEQTIGKVVADFRRALPQATIYVYDNNCTDATAENARKAGAIVRREKRQGKGWVVASMFEQVDADILVMVDGGDTYDAAAAQATAKYAALADAGTGVNKGNTVAGQKRDLRDAAVAGLKNRPCGLITELGQLLGDIGPHWDAFGGEPTNQKTRNGTYQWQCL